MPSPDAMIGRVKGWSAATIDAWHAQQEMTLAIRARDGLVRIL